MVLKLKPETETPLQALSESTGRAPEDLVEDAMAGYLAELSGLRKTLDSRYDDIKSGRVQPVDGPQAFAELQQEIDKRRSQ